MKKFLTLFVFGVLAAFAANAQYTETKDITPLGFTGDFQYVAYGKDNGIIAIANNNCVYTSKDTCKTWNVQKAPIDSIRGLTMAEDQKTGFIYNQYQIYKTIDGGKTWNKHETNGIEKVLDNKNMEYRKLYIKNIDTLFMVATNRVNGMRIYMSADRGTHWVQVAEKLYGNSYFDGIANMCFVTSNHGFAFGTAGFYAETKDGGLTWNKQIISHLTYFYDGIKCGDGTMLQVYDGGVPEVEGIKWAYFPNGSNKMCLAGDKIILLDSKGVQVTKDFGTTWTQIKLPSTGKDMFFLSEKIGVIIGSDLISYITKDGGETWTKFVHGGGEGFNDIYAKNDKECFITGKTGRMFHTKDGGETWTWQDFNITGLSNMTFPSQDTGYVISNDILLMTTDGGNTWIQKTNKHGGTIMDFVTPQIGFVGFIPNVAYLAKTTDEGDTWIVWTNKAYRENVKPYSFDFRNESDGLVTGNGNLLLHTVDGGQSWEIKESIPNNYYVWSVQSVADKGWLVSVGEGDFFGIFFCDNDFNCQLVFEGDNSNNNTGHMYCISDSVYYQYINHSHYISHDYGMTWEDAGFEITGQRSFVNEHLAYSFDSEYHLYKTYINVRDIEITIEQIEYRQIEFTTNIEENVFANIYIKDDNGNLHGLFPNYEIKKDIPCVIDIPQDFSEGSYRLFFESLNSAYKDTESEPFEISDETAVLDISKNQTYSVQGKTLYIYDSNAKLYTVLGTEIPIQNGVAELKAGVYILQTTQGREKVVVQ